MTDPRPGSPALPWRGLCLDTARSFLPVADVAVILDLMAPLGLNVLHLHLTDDQGWRLEIPGWPALTEVSGPTAVRGGVAGWYTAQDWDALASHARALGIHLIPEIDVPGHVHAALHAAPGLVPGGRSVPAYDGIEVGFSTLSSQCPDTDRFLGDVLAFATRISTAPWVHIGGDEAHGTPRRDYLALTRRAVGLVHAAGARVVAWQEAAEALEPGDVVQVWDERLDLSPVREAAERGVRVLLSPATRVYLDMSYAPGERLGQDWAATPELRDSFEWDPDDVVPGLPAGSVIGIEAALWTETVTGRDDATTLLLPRLAAAADVALRGSGLGRWEEFRRRVAGLSLQWDDLGLAWHRSPGVDWPA